MSKPVQLDAILGGISTRSDGSLSLRFSTLELSPEHTIPLLELRNQNLLMTLSPTDSHEPPQEIVAEKDAKTPSQRLRSVLYVLWCSLDEKSRGTFNQFYDIKMEKIIIWIKDKLPQE